MNRSLRNISQDQLDLIERYITAYNTIDHHLRNFFNVDASIPFSQLVRDYGAKYPRWKDLETLRMMGDLRNSIIHQRERMYEYLSVPIPSIVENIERIREEFVSPQRVFPKFHRAVECVDTAQPLSYVLRLIDQNGYSQFPVYREVKFIGLLTENGITRWLAHHSTNVMTLVELDEVMVETILQNEEARPNSQFISRNCTILEADNLFGSNLALEALLITGSGRSTETLMGIITRWDVLHV